MQTARFYCLFIWSIWCFLQVTADYVKLSHDGPAMLGAIITFRADLYAKDNTRPSGEYKYKFSDNTMNKNEYQIDKTPNTTTFWNIRYPWGTIRPGFYKVAVEVCYYRWSIICIFDASAYIEFEITGHPNGNITIEQNNKTIVGKYISSMNETKMIANIRKKDYDFVIQSNLTLMYYWFFDCHYFGHSDKPFFTVNFTRPTTLALMVWVEAYDILTTTTVLPPTTTTAPTNITAVSPNTTMANPNGSHVTVVTTTVLPTTVKSANSSIKPTTAASSITASTIDAYTSLLPFTCSNTSTISSTARIRIYGEFQTTLHVRDPILNISVEGTNWIQPWDMLSLNVTCKGSGPFFKCLQFHHGKYNVTGNETCNNVERLKSCNFSILHYFLEPSVYTILIILDNEVSIQVYPLTINIYKVTTKPQLSVIVVPVSCSLVAVVLIIFGVAYYIQSRARFTIEVADFDFGQNNPEMEYKTFRERLRDSFNNTGYKPLSNPPTLQ